MQASVSAKTFSSLLPNHTDQQPNVILTTATTSYYKPPRTSRATHYTPIELDFGPDSLDENLTSSPRRVESEFNRLSNAAGPLFRKGDSISFGQMSQGLYKFQQNLTHKIRASVAAVAAIDLNISGLMAETDTFRTGSVSTMADLFQRVNVARPIARGLNTTTAGASAAAGGGSSGPTSSGCWCQGAGTFACAFCGRTGNT